jgi:uncharacterized tellurite resistance protein B-like protein
MSFLRFLGGHPAEGGSAEQATLAAETEAVRRIVARLEELPPDEARLLASMAYILARAAYADMEISEPETVAMEEELVNSGLDASQAVLVVEMAKLQERTSGGTSDYLVTREFRERSTPEQRSAMLRACYRIAAADDALSGMETALLKEIASELDLDRDEAAAIRAEFADKITARRGLPTE